MYLDSVQRPETPCRLFDFAITGTHSRVFVDEKKERVKSDSNFSQENVSITKLKFLHLDTFYTCLHNEKS